MPIKGPIECDLGPVIPPNFPPGKIYRPTPIFDHEFENWFETIIGWCGCAIYLIFVLLWVYAVFLFTRT